MLKQRLLIGFVTILVLATAVSQAFAVWNFNFPMNGQSFNKNTGDGTGNAAANTAIRYRLMRSTNPEIENKHKDGNSAANGGWYLKLPTPLTTGANQTAWLLDMTVGGAGVIMATSTNLTVTN